MPNSADLKLTAMSEADLGPVLELLQGGDPDHIARHAGMTREKLLGLRDALLAEAGRQQPQTTRKPARKVGRNEPCPCGSGKKYKHCCLGRAEPPPPIPPTAETSVSPERKREQAGLVEQIEATFALLRDGRSTEACERAETLLERYPDEDRLHDILAAAHIETGDCDAAVAVCRGRLAVAEAEKAYFAAHGRHRDADIEDPPLSYFYPPLTWLQKCWIAVKAGAYQAACPAPDPTLAALVAELKTADDTQRFPATGGEGLEQRRRALRDTLRQLKQAGAETIAYLMPMAVRYGWAGIFVPEVLDAVDTGPAIRGLIDISMFGFAYASGASLHFLQQRGEAVVAPIDAALSRDREFDPIKTGIVSVLGHIHTEPAYALLTDLLAHESAHIVNWAGDALGRHGRIEALAALETASERIGRQLMIERAIRRLKENEIAA